MKYNENTDSRNRKKEATTEWAVWSHARIPSTKHLNTHQGPLKHPSKSEGSGHGPHFSGPRLLFCGQDLFPPTQVCIIS